MSMKIFTKLSPSFDPFLVENGFVFEITALESLKKITNILFYLMNISSDSLTDWFVSYQEMPNCSS